MMCAEGAQPRTSNEGRTDTPRAAGMQDMIDLIVAKTGFDPSQIATDRLRKQF